MRATRERCPSLAPDGEPAVVKKGYPGADPGPGLAAVRIALQVDVLVLERAPQPRLGRERNRLKSVT